jgi:hypothetical protein
MQFETFIAIIRAALLLIKFIRKLAQLWTDRKVHTLFRDWTSPIVMWVHRFFHRQRRIKPINLRPGRLWRWVEAGMLCTYVGYFLVLAAAIATVAVFGLAHPTKLSPLAEPSAAAFIGLLWMLAKFFYEEALLVRTR